MLLQVVGLDFAQEMLDDAARRDEAQPAYWDRAPIDWVCGDALDLPFDDASFDAATVGYGLRCVPPRQFPPPGLLMQEQRLMLCVHAACAALLERVLDGLCE